MAANQCNVFIMDEFTQQAISVALLVLYKVFRCTIDCILSAVSGIGKSFSISTYISVRYMGIFHIIRSVYTYKEGCWFVSLYNVAILQN